LIIAMQRFNCICASYPATESGNTNNMAQILRSSTTTGALHRTPPRAARALNAFGRLSESPYRVALEGLA
jgi:hypothetical protein